MARKNWLSIEGFIVFVIESAEPLAGFVVMGVQFNKLVEPCKTIFSPVVSPDNVAIILPPETETPPKLGAMLFVG